MINEEEKLSQLFQQNIIEQCGDVENQSAVEQAVETTNHQTGMRDLIVLYITSVFALFVGLIAPLCVQKHSSEQSNSNDTTTP